MRGLKTVMLKELTRVFKDKKMIFSLFILPMVMIIGICLLIFSLIINTSEDIEQHISIVYIQNAPEEFQSMLSQVTDVQVNYIETDQDLEEYKTEIYSGTIDLLIVFPEDFTEMIEDTTAQNVQVPQIKTYYNPSEDYSSEARNKFTYVYLETYRQNLIVDRFGSNEYVEVFSVDIDNTDSVIQDDEKATGKMIGMFLPYFITIMLFAGAMSLGVDVFTGEKERGTLASLLLTPLKRTHIVMGKIIALGILSILSALVYVVGMLVVIPIVIKQYGIEDMLDGLSISFNALQIIEILVLIIGIALLYVALVGFVAALSKTVKEAQTYTGLLYMVVVVSGMITMYTTEVKSVMGYFIPVYNISAAFKGIFTKDISGVEFLITIAITYGIAFLLILGISKAFKSEKVMFSM